MPLMHSWVVDVWCIYACLSMGCENSTWSYLSDVQSMLQASSGLCLDVCKLWQGQSRQPVKQTEWGRGRWCGRVEWGRGRGAGEEKAQKYKLMEESYTHAKEFTISNYACMCGEAILLQTHRCDCPQQTTTIDKQICHHTVVECIAAQSYYIKKYSIVYTNRQGGETHNDAKHWQNSSATCIASLLGT